MRVGLKTLLTSGLIAALSACAGGDGRYPSLALRPFETTTAAASAAPEPAEPIRPVASSAAIAALRDKADSAHAAFIRQQPATERLARAAAVQPGESTARAAALVAMADLSAQRGAVAIVLADLDLLAADAATTFAPAAEIEVARAAVLALIASEDAALAQLWESMES